jgi:hypothetical protein
MTDNVLSVNHAFEANCVPDLAPVMVMLRAQAGPISLVHLHHFDTLGYLPLVWRVLLVGLLAQGHTVFVSTCSGFDDEALDFLTNHEIFCLRRSNQGRCIGAYRDTALIAFQLASEGLTFRNVLFINDSVLPLGPDSFALQSLEEVMALVADRLSAALSGLTDSYEKGYHLQSYCLCANQFLLLDPVWQRFWQSLDVHIPKNQLISTGEVGLSLAMSASGVALLPLYPLITRLMLSPSVVEDLACCGEFSFKQINPSLFLWRALRDEGFPFVKKILLFALPTRLGGALGVQNTLAAMAPPTQMMLAKDFHRVLLSRALPAAAAVGVLETPPAPDSLPAPAELPTRLDELRKHVSKTALGMEIGPFHRPSCPKREGFNCLTVDILTRDQLLQAYADDQDVITLQEKVEEVDVLLTSDLVSSVAAYSQSRDARVKRAEGSLSYLISSHNFEHLPDPIAFLDDAATLLADGSFLTMAIPIGTRCFDCFRPLSTTGQLIDAHTTGRVKTTLGAIFDQSASAATHSGGQAIGDRSYDFGQVTVDACGGTIDESSFGALQFTHEFGHSGGIHSFVFNPYSFLLIMEDLQACGLLPLLRVRDVVVTDTAEFFVHIEKIPEVSRCPLPLGAERRTELLRQAIDYYIDDLHATLQRQDSP